MPPRIRLNSREIRRILNSPELHAQVNEIASDIAARIDSVPTDQIRVADYTTDRGASSVSVPTAAQARNGALTKAAAAAGLTVRQKP